MANVLHLLCLCLSSAATDALANTNPWSELSHAGANATGAAIGALVTARLLSRPLVRRTDGESYLGVAAAVAF